MNKFMFLNSGDDYYPITAEEVPERLAMMLVYAHRQIYALDMILSVFRAISCSDVTFVDSITGQDVYHYEYLLTNQYGLPYAVEHHELVQALWGAFTDEMQSSLMSTNLKSWALLLMQKNIIKL